MLLQPSFFGFLAIRVLLRHTENGCTMCTGKCALRNTKTHRMKPQSWWQIRYFSGSGGRPPEYSGNPVSEVHQAASELKRCCNGSYGAQAAAQGREVARRPRLSSRGEASLYQVGAASEGTRSTAVDSDRIASARAAQMW